eukprot:CAMPEP_0194447458 /NCGR_PEP_ID=MMETSP0176-20130528/129021_1 /TAXON_ID=216777 /ORGANISM="Proboscia alata, Strain PI-D3" /LENGTH=580 /DNA_ID=CAMNT_0039274317 /DNA_START=156 /DNA_END=1896 /DNA_ORIENTATION=-
MLSRSIATSAIVAGRSSRRLLPNVCCLMTTTSLWNEQGERSFSTAAPQTAPKEEKRGAQHGSNWRRDGSPPTNPLSNQGQGGNGNGNGNGGRNNNNFQGGRGNGGGRGGRGNGRSSAGGYGGRGGCGGGNQRGSMDRGDRNMDDSNPRRSNNGGGNQRGGMDRGDRNMDDANSRRSNNEFGNTFRTPRVDFKNPKKPRGGRGGRGFFQNQNRGRGFSPNSNLNTNNNNNSNSRNSPSQNNGPSRLGALLSSPTNEQQSNNSRGNARFGGPRTSPGPQPLLSKLNTNHRIEDILGKANSSVPPIKSSLTELQNSSRNSPSQNGPSRLGALLSSPTNEQQSNNLPRGNGNSRFGGPGTSFNGGTSRPVLSKLNTNTNHRIEDILGKASNSSVPPIKSSLTELLKPPPSPPPARKPAAPASWRKQATENASSWLDTNNRKSFVSREQRFENRMIRDHRLRELQHDLTQPNNTNPNLDSNDAQPPPQDTHSKPQKTVAFPPVDKITHGAISLRNLSQILKVRKSILIKLGSQLGEFPNGKKTRGDYLIERELCEMMALEFDYEVVEEDESVMELVERGSDWLPR